MNFIPQMEPNYDEKETEACYNYMKSGGWITEFRETSKFAESICKFTGAKYCHVVNNGTISLSIALLAVGVKSGDKVIVPNLTMIATANAVKLIGAKPIFVDIEESSLCLDIDKTKELIENDNIKAVFHVSLNTRCNDIIKLKEICKENNVYLLEDSAQSLGSYYKGQHLGTFGDIGSFSFSSPKIISTGQGGALITNSEELSENIKKIKDFGRCAGGSDLHDSFGINSKFTDLQAVVGIEQMKKLDWRVNRMKEIWNIYYNRLSKNENIQMIESSDPQWIPWFIDIYIDNKKELQEYLKENNIGSRPVYLPITNQKIYNEYDDNINFNVSKKYSEKGLWLPSSTKLTDTQINYICDTIINFYQK